jgi:hypothetical protein
MKGVLGKSNYVRTCLSFIMTDLVHFRFFHYVWKG